MIQIELDQEHVILGETISGMVIWTPEAEVTPQAVIVALAWHTEGRGTTAKDQIAEIRNAPGMVFAGMPTEFPFRFEVPEDGPVTYNGKLIRVIWEIVVRIDVPWAWDPKESQAFFVGPRTVSV